MDLATFPLKRLRVPRMTGAPAPQYSCCVFLSEPGLSFPFQKSRKEETKKQRHLWPRPNVSLMLQSRPGQGLKLVNLCYCMHSPGCEQFDVCNFTNKWSAFVGANKCETSQMPCHLISDAHEWINEITTVPIYYLAKPQQREQTL